MESIIKWLARIGVLYTFANCFLFVMELADCVSASYCYNFLIVFFTLIAYLVFILIPLTYYGWVKK